MRIITRTRNAAWSVAWSVAALVTAPATAQFVVTNVSVQRQPLPFDSTKYTVFSGATYYASVFYNRDATHGNEVYVGNVFNSPWAHTIQGPFTNGQLFACDLSTRGVFNPFPCSAVVYYHDPPCSQNVTLWSSASVNTTGLGGWTAYGSWGGTNEFATCVPEPPPPVCGAGYGRTTWGRLDLGESVSASRPIEGSRIDMKAAEEVGGKHYYQDQFLVVERDSTGRYVPLVSTGKEFEAEGLSVLEQSSPPRFRPERVFLVKSAEHENAHLMPTPDANFGEGFMAKVGRPGPRPGLDSEEPPAPRANDWRFLARFDVLPHGERTGEVVWSPDRVPGWWMDVLNQNLTLTSDKPVDHRVTVYAVVEVGETVTVRQRVSFVPRCCCGEVICL